MLSNEEIKKEIRSNIEQLTATPYPEDLLNEWADSSVPIYYHEIIREWTDLESEDIDRWQEVGQPDKFRIYDLMLIDLWLFYQNAYLIAWEEVKAELEEGEED